METQVHKGMDTRVHEDMETRVHEGMETRVHEGMETRVHEGMFIYLLYSVSTDDITEPRPCEKRGLMALFLSHTHTSTVHTES